MNYSYDIITVGDAKLDMFVALKEANHVCQVDHTHSTLCLPFGSKIKVDKLECLMGGNAANVAVGLARLGIRATLCAEIGDDEFSLKIVNSLAKEQVDRGLLTYTPQSQSSFSIALEVGGDRTIFSEHVVRPHNFKLESTSAQYVYITSLGAEWKEPYEYVLNWAKEQGSKVAFNPGSLQLQEGGEIIEKILRSSEILFVNKEEGKRMTNDQLPISKEKDEIKDLLTALQKMGPKIVVMTDGANGSYALDETGQMYSQPIFPAKVVGRTGAGDAYATGFLGAIFLGQSVQIALQWGAVNSAAVVEHIGAEIGLLKRGELESRLKSITNTIGWTTPLYILAFDHRNTFAEHMFGGLRFDALTSEQNEEIKSYKMLIYQGFQMAVQNGIPKVDAAILVDEQYGDAVLQQASADGFKTILTIEKTGQPLFEFQYDDQFGEHIEKYKPTFTKVLIKYNPDDPQAKTQLKNLEIISTYSHEQGYKFLVEPLIAATKEQLAKVDNDQKRYDAEIRPDLVVRMIQELQAAHVEPDIWKLEGLDSQVSYENVVKQARVDGRNEVSVVILGRGAGEDQVEKWLEIGAQVPGVVGFAVGRTIFWEPLMAVHNKTMSREEAVKKISEEFYKLYTVFKNNALSS